jgi:alpha-tubulin suppressor-like RCC1 family protein
VVKPRTSLAFGAALISAVLVAGCSTTPAPSRSRTTGSHTATTAGTVSAVEHWGSFFGGTKHGNFGITRSPATVLLPGRVAEVGSSNSTEYALLTNGRLYAWGLGTEGELGDGSWDNSLDKPVLVRFPAGVKIASIPTDAMPYDTGLAVDTQGHIWGWGINGGGELCLGNTQAHSLPVELPLAHVSVLAGASNHALYDSDGTLYACGQNVSGDLGDGSMRDTTTPVRVADLNGAQVVTLVAAFANSGALLTDGQYYDWGTDITGQLGDGRTGHSSDVPVLVKLADPVTVVAQGGSIWNNGQTLVMLSDGTLWAWGNDRAGQLGNHSTHAQPTPVPFVFPSGMTVESLATGSATSYAVCTDGSVYAWGVSHVGQLGDGFTRSSATPVKVATGATAISATANNVVINTPDR